MPSYEPPLRDYRFILHEALKVQDETEIEGYAELTEDFTGAVLGEAGKIAAEVLAPLNQAGDRQGCRLENGVVRTPDGFREAFALLREGGWPSMECDPDYGGQGMPALLNLCVDAARLADPESATEYLASAEAALLRSDWMRWMSELRLEAAAAEHFLAKGALELAACIACGDGGGLDAWE